MAVMEFKHFVYCLMYVLGLYSYCLGKVYKIATYGRTGRAGGGGGGQTGPGGQYSLHSRVNGSRTLGSLKVFYKKYMRNSDSLNIAHF